MGEKSQSKKAIPFYVSSSGHYLYTKPEDRERAFKEAIKNVRYTVFKSGKVRKNIEPKSGNHSE